MVLSPDRSRRWQRERWACGADGASPRERPGPGRATNWIRRRSHFRTVRAERTRPAATRTGFAISSECGATRFRIVRARAELEAFRLQRELDRQMVEQQAPVQNNSSTSWSASDWVEPVLTIRMPSSGGHEAARLPVQLSGRPHEPSCTARCRSRSATGRGRPISTANSRRGNITLAYIPTTSIQQLDVTELARSVIGLSLMRTRRCRRKRVTLGRGSRVLSTMHIPERTSLRRDLFLCEG